VAEEIEKQIAELGKIAEGSTSLRGGMSGRCNAPRSERPVHLSGPSGDGAVPTRWPAWALPS
jgi:hypothetical protein